MSKNTDNNADMAQVPTDGQLVFSVLGGDQGAFSELVRRYQRRASAVAYRLLNNRDDTLEVTQDAFLRAYDRLSTLENPERFGSWFLRILSNLALNRRRSRALRKMTSLDASYSDEENDRANGARNPADRNMATPLEQVAGNDMRDRLRLAIDELPDIQKQALVMFSIEKMPQKEVAEILNCSVEAVKWHVFSARKKLKELIEN